MSRIAIITGSDGGIGRALCEEFKTEGYRVIGIDKSCTRTNSDESIPIDLDEFCVSNVYHDQKIVDLLSLIQDHQLKVLINNAALQVVKPIDKLTVMDWQSTLNVNLIAPFLLSQALLPYLRDASGSIINISSIHAKLTKSEFSCYATSKAALVGLTRSMAVEIGEQVRVNAICPAAVSTPMLVAGFDGKEEQFAELSKMHPVGRIGKPQEIAQLAIFLASSRAQFINGAIMSIDGGIGGRLHDPG